MFTHSTYHAHHAHGFANMIVSAVVHSLIWSFVGRMMRGLTLADDALVLCAGLLIAFGVHRMLRRY